MSVSTGLSRALRHMLPNAEVALVHERPWFSMTFAGAQICISVSLRGDGHIRAADEFVAALPAQEFDMRRQVVADIAVIERVDKIRETRLLVSALLLDD